jgi:DNA mismatch repair protein MutS2
LDSKSLEMLEFPQIAEIIAGFTSFSAGRALAAGLQPSADYEQVSLLLRQSAEARRLLAIDSAFSIGGVNDIREAAVMAARGKVLEPLVLLEVRQTLAAMRHLRASLEKVSGDFPLLWEIAAGIVVFRDIEKAIDGCLSPNGEVLDSASPKLAAIRRQLREVRQQLLDRLKVTMESPRGRTVVQEPIITEREGRYVIPVRIEHRKEIKGIVHDVSNSGATVFIEPWVAVDLGNTLRELEVEEGREIERILSGLSAQVGAGQTEITQGIARTAALDLAMAKARYARRVNATEPLITGADEGKPVSAASDRVLRLVQARHPLLADKAVPLSVEIGRDFSVLVVTGPNTGGKTVALKTVGLLSLMAQAGLPIPAAPESQIPVFDNVFADIGDEQSIEKTLSTFSWHIGNITRIINSTTGKSLVLLDELGTSTDPTEGSALARAILLHFHSRGAMAIVTTHFSDLKAFAHTTPGLQNASLDFDQATLTPTYHLTVGIPGGSNALATAERLGLPREIVAAAREMLTKGSQEMEALLASLVEEKKQVETCRDDLKRQSAEAARRNAELEKERRRLAAEEREAIQQSRDKVVQEAAAVLQELRQAATVLRREQTGQRVEEARQAIATARERLRSEAWQPKAAPETAGTGDDERIRVGDTVRVKEASLQAIVISISEETQQLEAQAGQAKLRLGLQSVEKVKAPRSMSGPEYRPVGRPSLGRPVPMELDLRGKRAEEVVPALDSYLNSASLANLSEVRIIHGMATGVVRKIVRETLATHPLVKSFRPAEKGEGGDGATVATL